MFNKSIKTKVAVLAFALFSCFSFAQGDFLGEDESGFQILFSAQNETVEDGVDFSVSYSFNGTTDVSIFYGSYVYPDGIISITSSPIHASVFGVKLTQWIRKGIEIPFNTGIWAEYQSESYGINNRNFVEGSKIGIGFVTSYHASINEEKLYIHPYLSVGIESDTKNYQQTRKDTVAIGTVELGNNLGFRVGDASSVYIRSSWVNSSQNISGIIFGIGFLQGL